MLTVPLDSVAALKEMAVISIPMDPGGLRNPILHRCRHAKDPIDVSHTNFAVGSVKKNNKVILKHSSHGTGGDDLKSF